MKMRMMLVGSGAVGHCIVKQLLNRDPNGEWFAYALLCDIDLTHAQSIQNDCKDERLECAVVDADKSCCHDGINDQAWYYVCAGRGKPLLRKCDF